MPLRIIVFSPQSRTQEWREGGRGGVGGVKLPVITNSRAADKREPECQFQLSITGRQRVTPKELQI